VELTTLDYFQIQQLVAYIRYADPEKTTDECVHQEPLAVSGKKVLVCSR
jgi:hypothetical protein